jgi:hypothetical protein
MPQLFRTLVAASRLEHLLRMWDTMLKGKRIRQFFEAEAAALQSRFRVIETLIPSQDGRGSGHRGEEGRHIESLLRDFLNRHLPTDIRALSGFILRPATKTGADDLRRVESSSDDHSSQLDIIIYDLAKYPIYERFEEFVVVPPEGVVGIVSVKKTLRLEDLKSEFASLERGARLCKREKGRGPYLGLFAFVSESQSREDLGAGIFRRIEEHFTGKAFDFLVNEVSVLDQLVVFKFSQRDSPSGTAKYVRIDCVDRVELAPVMHIALQRMIQSILGVYYDSDRGATVGRPGFVSFNKGQFNEAPLLGTVNVE